MVIGPGPTGEGSERTECAHNFSIAGLGLSVNPHDHLLRDDRFGGRFGADPIR